MARNNDKDRRDLASNNDDDDFVIYKWEFPETKDDKGKTKYFVAAVVRLGAALVSAIRRIVTR